MLRLIIRTTLLALLILIVVGMVIPGSRNFILGWLSGEPKFEGKPLRYWVYLLRDSHYSTRQHAAFSLGEIGAAEPQVIAALIEATRDEDYGVRRCAARALGALEAGARPAIPALIELTKDSLHMVRRDAAVALARVDIRSDDVIRTLVAMTRDGEGSVASWAMGSLGRAAPDLGPLVPFVLRNTKESEMIQVVQTLPDIGLSRAIELLTHKDAATRAGVAKAFAEMGELGRPALPKLRALLEDGDAEVRFSAALAVWRIDKQYGPLLPLLVTKLQNTKLWADRNKAAFYLAEIGPPAREAVPLLIETLKDKYEDLRMLAADALGAIGASSAPALAQLETALQDEDHEVRRRAARAIEQINQGLSASGESKTR